MDRTYWHVPEARSWHALDRKDMDGVSYGLCGFDDWRAHDPQTVPTTIATETADRLPPTAHLCGNCSRIIAARTDIEDASRIEQSLFEVADRVSDVPEPVASEQDDSV